LARLNERTRSYVTCYPEAVAFAEAQQSIFWTAEEINVAKDIMDLRVHNTEAETHGIITTLRLFTLYELVAGTDYWLGRVMRRFPRPDVQMMAATFGFFELGVHAKFYSKINEELNLATDAFYLDYVNDPVLASRMSHIEDMVTSSNDLESVGAFSMVEGGVLYSAFAFLKHFQQGGKNQMLNTCRGVNFSVRDENLHCEGGTWLFKTLLAEKVAEGSITPGEIKQLRESLWRTAVKLTEHEHKIVDMIFEKGEIDGIDRDDLKLFISQRIKRLWGNLFDEPTPEETSNVAKWFYKDINMVKFHDFFTGIGSEYNRDWNEDKLRW